MKTVNVDGTDIIIFRERGQGDGGMAIRYLMDAGDGTFVGKHVWWSDPMVADDVYQNQTIEYLRWAKSDALRRQTRSDGRAKEEVQPDPTPRVRVGAAK